MKNHLSSKETKLFSIYSLFLAFCINLIVHSDNASAYIEKGKQHRQNNLTSAEHDAFMQAYKLDPNNAEILWRLSRVYVDLANLEKNEDKQKDLYKKLSLIHI